MLTSIAEFIRYFERVRARTTAMVEAIPAERMDWAPHAGEYTIWQFSTCRPRSCSG